MGSEMCIRDSYDDMFEIQHGPTRKREKLDLLYTNHPSERLDARICCPLENAHGVPSDHGCVVVQMSVPKAQKYTWVKKKIRRRTEEGNAKFKELVEQQDWVDFYRGTNCPTTMVKQLHDLLNSWMDACFPLKTSRRRLDEDPWITNGIRRKMRMRMRIFLREGRSKKWKKINKEIRKLIREKKMEFVAKLVSEGKRNDAAYFRLVKQLSVKERPEHWTVSLLYQDLDDDGVAAEVVDFFGAVSDLLPALDYYSRPQNCADTGMDLFTEGQVSEMLKAAKKPSSMVQGDILPQLYGNMELAGMVTPVFNAIISSRTWPEAWKVETLTVIPKVPKPANLSECRNISCTNFLSKVMENALLLRLRKEIAPDPIQYGLSLIHI